VVSTRTPSRSLALRHTIWDRLDGLGPPWALHTSTHLNLRANTTCSDSTIAVGECALSEERESAERASRRAGGDTRVHVGVYWRILAVPSVGA